MNKKIKIILPVVVVAAMLIMACSVCGNLGQIKSQIETAATELPATAQVFAETSEAFDSTVESEQATAESEPESDQTMPEATPGAPEADEGTPAATGDGQVEGEEVPLDLDLDLNSLKNLDSYRSNMLVEWQGTQSGEDVSGYLEIKAAYVREPPAAELIITSEGFDAGDVDQGIGTVSFVRVGDTAWFLESQSGTWMQVPADTLDFEDGFYNFTPDDFVSGFEAGQGRRSPTPEQVNGVKCYKYTFDEKAITDMQDEGITRLEGEAYVAVDGNYLVKLIMQADMNSQAAEEIMDSGTMTLELNLTDINQPITITPPAEADEQAQYDDLPMLPDAEVEFSSAEFITYSTASSVEDAAKFYDDEMPVNGWTSGSDNMMMEDSAILTFTKDNRTASIVITTGEEEATSVIISIETQ